MLKELMIVMFVFGIPMLFIMSYAETDATGAISSEISQIRLDRINTYHAFKITTANKIHKQISERVRSYILAGAHDNFYQYNMLRNGDEFFQNERDLLQNLQYLMCNEQPTEFMPSYETMRSVGTIQCDIVIKSQAEQAFNSVVRQDFQLIAFTLKNSKCPEKAESAIILARKALDEQKYSAMITNLHLTWRLATEC